MQHLRQYPQGPLYFRGLRLLEKCHRERKERISVFRSRVRWHNSTIGALVRLESNPVHCMDLPVSVGERLFVTGKGYNVGMQVRWIWNYVDENGEE